MKKLLGRFDVISWYELPEDEQKNYCEYYDKEGYYFINDSDRVISMIDCMYCDTGRYSGVIGLTNTSGIGVVLSSDGSQAVLQLVG